MRSFYQTQWVSKAQIKTVHLTTPLLDKELLNPNLHLHYTANRWSHSCRCWRSSRAPWECRATLHSESDNTLSVLHTGSRYRSPWKHIKWHQAIVRQSAKLWQSKPNINILKKQNNKPLRVSVVHAHIHQHITDEAVAIGWAVIEDLAHHRVVEVVCWGVGNGLHHEHWVPEHVGVWRVNVAVDRVLHFGAEFTEREHMGKGENTG